MEEIRRRRVPATAITIDLSALPECLEAELRAAGFGDVLDDTSGIFDVDDPRRQVLLGLLYLKGRDGRWPDRIPPELLTRADCTVLPPTTE